MAIEAGQQLLHVVSWDLGADDDTFLAIQRVPDAGVQTEILIVLDWPDEVRRLAGGP